MLLPFPDFQGQGISFFSSQPPPSPSLTRRKITEEAPKSEPNSVLDTMISPTSSSTVSSSHGNAITGAQCDQIGLTDWEEQLPHHQDNEQSILRLIMGDDSTDPSHELNTILQSSPGFGVLDSPGLDHHHHHSLPSPSHLLINQSQTHYIQNPSAIFYNPPPAKRLNPGPIGIKETLLKAAEVIVTGDDTCLAQTILARLNQILSSPIGKPFERSAFYFKEALNNLLHHNNNISQTQTLKNPYSLIFKIAAYKSFSEISPVLQFANFTSNQALLESFNGFNRLHIVDFDIGYGGQWASLMQELVLRDNSAPISLKITIFSSPANHEIDFTLENLKLFASEINISLEIQVLSLDLIDSMSWPKESDQEAIAVNLSAASFSHLPLILRSIKQLSPTIIVFSDKGCERTDLPFPQQIAHSLHSHASLLESLDAVNPNFDAMQKIERFIIQPEIEKLVMNRSRSINQPMMMTWQAMFLQMGFSPMMYSNVTESQAECLVQRTPVKGFHVEKKHNSLVLCWHMTELIGVSAWR